MRTEMGGRCWRGVLARRVCEARVKTFLKLREVLVEGHDLGGERMGCAEMLRAPNTCVVIGAGGFCQRHLRGVVVDDATISLYHPGW